MARFLIVSALVILLVAGCGGGGAAPGAGDSVSYDFGTVQIEGSSGLRQVQIDSPDASPVLFTGYYGGRITRLTEVGFERLAIASTRPGTSSYDICTINEDGSGFQRLTTWPYEEMAPQYSRDGTGILFECDATGHNREIYRMDSDGTDIVRLTSSPGLDMTGAWSPDGTRIAWVSARTGVADIWVMSADGEDAIDLTNTSGPSEYYPSWSPDGRRIVFERYDAVEAVICVMDADGGNTVYLTAGRGHSMLPTWSPDGRRIAFLGDRGGVTQVCSMDPDGRNEVVESSVVGLFPERMSYSPDGTRLAFAALDVQILVQRIGDTTARGVTQGIGANHGPSWCPVPQPVRYLVGPTRSDGGSEPPFGSARPLAILGIGAEGLVEAVTVDVLSTMWSSLSLEALEGTGAALAAVRIEGTQIDTVREDCGRGIAPRVWSTPSPTGTKSVTIVFSASTGRIASVLASSATALSSARAAAAVSGDALVLTGPFDAVWGADPDRNLAPAGAARVVLDAATGVPVRVER